jgi:hypothetical protein
MPDSTDRGDDRPVRRRPADGAGPGTPSGADRTRAAAHTVFAQPWWLDAVAPDGWGESVVERGGEVIARLPYAIKERFGLRVLTQPPLTRYLGPWIRTTGAKPTKQLENEKDLMSELVRGLPRFDVFRQNFPPVVSNWLPFYWKGFEATARCTYRIEDLSDLDLVWADFAHSARSHIRKAQKQLSVRTDLGVDVLLGLHRQVFARQGLPAPVGEELLHRLDETCAERKARTLLFAVDAQERVHGAAFVAHDGDLSYLLLSGLDTELRNSGAKSLLVWEAIRCSAAVSRGFDFAGSMIESVERFNRGFGARQHPYLYVTRSRRHARALLAAQGELRAMASAVRKRIAR